MCSHSSPASFILPSPLWPPSGLCNSALNSPRTLGLLPGRKDCSDWGPGPGLACWSSTSVQGGSGLPGQGLKSQCHPFLTPSAAQPPGLYLRVRQPLPLGGSPRDKVPAPRWVWVSLGQWGTGTPVCSCSVSGKGLFRTQGRPPVGQVSWAQGLRLLEASGPNWMLVPELSQQRRWRQAGKGQG